MTDEGFYVTSGQRLFLGDRLFADSGDHVASLFNVFVAGIFMIKEDVTLYQLRMIQFIMHIIASLAIFLVIEKMGIINIHINALLCASIFFANNYLGLMAPSYNTLGSDFLIYSLAIYVYCRLAVSEVKLHAKAIIGAVLSAVCLFGSVLSHFAMFPLFILPFFDILYNHREGNRHKAVFACISFFTLILLFVGIMLCLSINGYISDLRSLWSLGSLERNPAVGAGVVGLLLHALKIPLNYCSMVPDYGEAFLTLSIVFLGFIAGLKYTSFKMNNQLSVNVWFGLSKLNNQKIYTLINKVIFAIMLIYIFASFLLIILIILKQRIHTINMVFVYLSGLYFLFYLVATVGIKSENENRKIFILFSIPSILASILFASTTYFYNFYRSYQAATQGISFVFVLGFVGLYRCLTIYGDMAGFRKIFLNSFLVTFSSFVLILCAYNSYKIVYRDDPLPELTKQFNISRLRNIYSTPQRVEEIESIVGYLKEKVKPGDFLLAYDHASALYYLTETRPATMNNFLGFVYTQGVGMQYYRNMISKMINHERNSKYVVTVYVSGEKWSILDNAPEDYPLEVYRKENYVFEKEIYPFKVYCRKEDISTGRKQ